MTLMVELTENTIDKLATLITEKQEEIRTRRYTIAELAEALGIPVNTLRKKKLPYYQADKNSQKYYDKYEVIDFLRR